MKQRRTSSAFTLFELILAIALSATLLALVGTAINLYLLRVDASRTQVEEAQLARAILSTIAADIRATSVYQPQDISSVARLASSMASFDVDDIDQAGEFTGGGPGLGGTNTTGGVGAAGGVGSATAMGSSGSSSSGSASGSSSDGSTSTDSTTTVPGVNGSLNEMYLDVNRLPRLDDLFAAPVATSASSGATPVAAAPVAGPRPSDAKTVHYFVRQGAAVDPSDAAATAISPQDQARVGGLVRQTLDQAVRIAAEQTGNSGLLESGQELLAPEVTAIEFRYFDGSTAYNEWNMQEHESALPPAVEVRIWMSSADASAAAGSSTSGGLAMPGTRMYSQTVELPLASTTGSTASSSSEEEESTDGSTSGANEGSSGLGTTGG